MPKPEPDEVLVKMQAAPINPSDLGVMFGAADLSTARSGTRGGLPMITADVPSPAMRVMAGRAGSALPIGNEGCGVVVSAGGNPDAQALLGKTVALFGGGMYSEYRSLPAQMAMELPAQTDPADGAACFVNPLTSLAFVETMRMEGHSAIVHTAAASSLGRMLVRICAKDGIPLVNIVRSDAQVEILTRMGAEHVVDSSAADFRARLGVAIGTTGATLGFDAVGGGRLAGQILSAMEALAMKGMPAYSPYGSDLRKQVYIYGSLDLGPTVLNRNFGLTWSIGGFLLAQFLQRAGNEVAASMRRRVVDELTTTFKNHYSREIPLIDALSLDIVNAYQTQRTGEKFLLRF